MLEKVLITGGAGFIGSHVADILVNLGHEVVIVDNLCTGRAENINPKAKFYCEDIREKNLRNVMEKERPAYVIHHASQINVRKSIDDPVYDAENNIIGSLNLLEASKNIGVKKIIFASSGGTVYGNPDELPVKEDSPIKPLSPYGIAKASVERYLDFYFRTSNLNYASLRYGNVYGPRQNPGCEAGIVPIFINKMLNLERPCIWGDGDQTRDFVYVADVAKANVAALEYDGNEHVFNIGTGKQSSVNCIYSLLKLGLASPVQAQYNKNYAEEIPKFALDNSRALRELGWASKTTLEDGLKKTINAIRKDRHWGGK